SAGAERRARRNEPRVVVRVGRALAAVAKVLRRAVLLYAVREIAERVARRRLEHRVAHQRVLRGGWQSERREVRRSPRPTHALHLRDLGRELADAAGVAIQRVERARTVVRDEPRLT